MGKCRVCLRDSRTSIILTQEAKKKFMQITGIDLSEDIDEHLCYKCNETLQITWKFRSDAIIADMWFRLPEPCVKVEAIFLDQKPKEEYICDYCDSRFPKHEQIKSHMRQHLKELGLICSFCNKRFPDQKKRGYHERSHIETMKRRLAAPSIYTCEICGKCFTDVRGLIVHKNRGHNKKYKCTVESCSDMFENKKLWISHIQTKHGIPNPFKCEDCGHTFTSDKSRFYHIRQFHSNGEKLVSCNECPKKFLWKSALRKHIGITHRGERNHMCDICFASYTVPFHLKRHYHNSHYDAYLEKAKAENWQTNFDK